MTIKPHLHYDSASSRIICEGEWTIAHVPALKRQFKTLSLPASRQIMIDGKGITNLDSAGAWLLIEQKARLEKNNIVVTIENLSEPQQELINIIEKKLHQEEELPQPQKINSFAYVGKFAFDQVTELKDYLSFIGSLTFEVLRLGLRPAHWRIPALVNVIYRTGYLALPIIALLSFMIGVVLTYQMGLQLRNYGASVYIVDLLGLAVLREFGPLLTAIMVAGRTGSAFTAQLGMMKINQEIDALNTMGVTPAELLLLPRILGLLIVLPLLSVWADIWGVVGGMVMSSNMLSISVNDFIHRFPHVIKLKTLLIGLVKTPVFAFIIASIGCFEGMQVGTSAESVGRNTTRSVVLAIFFIIVADAIFSIIFSKLKL